MREGGVGCVGVCEGGVGVCKGGECVNELVHEWRNECG